LKFKISKELLVLAGQDAARRGITLEQYIEEFIGILNEEKVKGNVALDSKSISDALQSDSKL
jgi:hypothetical protein